MSSDVASDYFLSRMTKGDRTRLHILESSLKCFVRLGFEGASISELTAQSGAPRSAINHYFQTKETLIYECLRYSGISGKSYTNEFMASRVDIPDPIERYAHATLIWRKDYPAHMGFLWLCIQRGAYDSRTRKQVEEIFDGARSRVEGLLSQKPWEISSLERRKLLARQIHTTVIGFAFMSHLSGSSRAKDSEDLVGSCSSALRSICEGGRNSAR